MSGITIIIPVHNGAHVLSRTMSSLARQPIEDAVVVIALNGCRDDSRRIADEGRRTIMQSGAKAVEVIELPQGSRVAALRAAETGRSGPWLYLDQDGVLSLGALGAIRDALRNGVHFVGLEVEWLTRSRIVRQAMGAWNALPYVKHSPVTAGAYAVSAQGRKRWGAWLDGVPDDKYARLHFRPSERVRIRAHYQSTAPSGFRELVAARARYRAMNVRLGEAAPHLAANDLRRSDGLLSLIASEHFPGLCVLAAAEAAALLAGTS